jgi:hypothetical protein
VKLRHINAIIVILVVAMAGLAASCAGKNSPKAQSAMVADYGAKLLDAVKVAQDAVIKAEANRALSTEKARMAMVIFKKIGDASQQLAQELRLYAALDRGSAEAQTKAEVIQNYLKNIDDLVLDVLIPIDQDPVREQLSGLLKHINQLITTITLELSKR